MKRIIGLVIDKLVKKSNAKYKQVILIRKDLRLPAGKLAAQAAHASVDAVMESDKEIISKWHREGMKKIVLKVKNESELMKIAQKARDYGLVSCVVVDAGRTVVEPGTKTACGIGPDFEKKIDKVTGKLGVL